MYYMFFDKMNGTILGFSVDEKPNDNYYQVNEETYNFILDHNGEYIIDLNTINDTTVLITKDNLCLPQANLQEVIQKQLNKNNALCKMFIEDGIYYVINNIKKHFTYKIEDQINFMEIYNLYKNNIFNEEIPIRASEEKEYIYITVDMFLDIYNKLLKNKYYQLFYLRQVNDYISNMSDINSINRFQYEMILPKKYQDKLDKQMKYFNKL